MTWIHNGKILNLRIGSIELEIVKKERNKKRFYYCYAIDNGRKALGKRDSLTIAKELCEGYAKEKEFLEETPEIIECPSCEARCETSEYKYCGYIFW